MGAVERISIDEEERPRSVVRCQLCGVAFSVPSSTDMWPHLYGTHSRIIYAYARSVAVGKEGCRICEKQVDNTIEEALLHMLEEHPDHIHAFIEGMLVWEPA